jgi:hypothetical protein
MHPLGEDMKPVYTFSKRVRDDTSVRSKDITDPVDVFKLDQVIQKLDTLPRAMTSRLDEIGLRTNPKKWINSLIRHYPDINRPDMESLLIDFTDAMMTRMREETKYALGLLMESKLVLCHSIFGEETITPEWKIIPRMLDTDNVLRYVCFTDEKGTIGVKYWEREATSSFTEWLGLPRKQAFLFGGKYRIYCEIDGVTTELQLTEQEMEYWLNEHPELKDGKIKLSSPIQLLSVIEIRTGRKRYQNAEDFIQDYKAENYGVPNYQKEYERIKGEHLPLLMKYYDDKTQVVRKEGDQETIEVTKSATPFDILFANGAIEFRASYLTELARRFINGEPVRIFHAGLKFKASPFTLGTMEVYNDLQLNGLARQIVRYYNETNLQDVNLDALLKYTALSILKQANRNSPIAYVFESLSRQVMRELSLQGKLSKVEDTVVEYKSRDILAGGDSQVIKDLAQDLRTKLSKSPCKIYIVGIEDSGTFDPFPTSRLKSDRVETIRSGLRDQLDFADIFAFPAVHQEEAVLLIIALRT